VDINLPALAGTMSTIMFVIGAMPMLHKAFSTKDMAYYSLGNLLLMNAGNLIYAVYVFSLPPGPIWALHGFWLVATALMLGWYLRYERNPASGAGAPASTTDSTQLAAVA
jgi:hypothetical protein